MREFTTSEDHLPEDTSGETTLQVTDTETKEIFRTRARIAREADALDDPVPLTVVRGPHENVEEQWYVEVLEADEAGEIDRERLRDCVRRSREESNVINARSEDLRSMLSYLVATGEYGSVSEAVRDLLLCHLAAERQDLLDAYVDVKADLDRAELADSLRGERP